MISFLVLLGAAANVAALPMVDIQSWASNFKTQTWLGPQLPVTSPYKQRFMLPSEDTDPLLRKREIEERQRGFLYGPSLLGNSSFFPSGVLGGAMVQQHQDQWYNDAAWLTQTVNGEAAAAMASIQKVTLIS